MGYTGVSDTLKAQKVLEVVANTGSHNTGGCLDKHNVVPPFSGVSLSLEKEGHADPATRWTGLEDTAQGVSRRRRTHTV